MSRTSDAPVLVLIDLAPAGVTFERAHGEPFLVRLGGLRQALRRVRSGPRSGDLDDPDAYEPSGLLQLTLDLDEVGPLAASTHCRRASLVVQAARDLDPDRLVRAVPLGARLSSLRTGLVAIHNVLASVREVRRSLAEELDDPARHAELRAALAARGVRSLDPVLRPTSAEVAAVQEHLARAVDGRGRNLLYELTDRLHAVAGELDDGDALHLALPAFVIEALQPRAPDDAMSRALVGRMFPAIDELLSALVDELLDAEPVSALEPLLRDLERLAARTAFVAVPCPRALLDRPSDALVAHVLDMRPRVIVTPHRLDPRVDDATIAAWAALARRVGAIFAADAPLELAGEVRPNDRWRQLLDAHGRSFLLFPQRWLTRGAYAADGEPTRLRLASARERPPDDRPWGSTALFLAPLLAADPHEGVASFEWQAVAWKQDAACADPAGEPADDRCDAPVLRARVQPPVPSGDAAERWALGLCDVHARRIRGEIRLYAPRCAFERLADGLPPAWVRSPALAPERASDEATRRAFWRSGATSCLRCGAPLQEQRDVDGCRPNGDAWGTMEFECECGWSTWLRFDDAVDDNGSYYFETVRWRSDG